MNSIHLISLPSVAIAHTCKASFPLLMIHYPLGKTLSLQSLTREMLHSHKLASIIVLGYFLKLQSLTREMLRFHVSSQAGASKKEALQSLTREMLRFHGRVARTAVSLLHVAI